MTTRKHKSISRMDHSQKNTHGWYVRVAFKGKIHSHFFSDASHRGKRLALKAALAWRDDTERALGKPRTERSVVAASPRNRTGVIGVRRTTKARTRDGRKVSPVYEVTWRPASGLLHRTTFSIRKYGKEEAFRRACAFRKEKEREMYGAELPPLKTQRRKKNGKTTNAPTGARTRAGRSKNAAYDRAV
ncbi:MAG TPA: AP2 domain-containing protein [Anaerolineae bacterium]|nr:AP2 domain-containing protein [Anaerolineae bacterium]